MSELDRLISLYCPNGVAYEKLGDVVRFINGRAYKQTELLDSGKYRVLRVGNFFTSDKWYYSDLELDDEKYCDNGDLLYAWAASLGPKIWDGGKTIFHYHIWKIEFDEKRLSKQYLYHFLQKDVNDIYGSLTHSTMPHVSMVNMKERKIPVPPIEVQREIVRILDKFTELAAELAAELSLRQKQLSAYSTKLFDKAKEDWPVFRVEEICTIEKGKTPIQKAKSGAYPLVVTTSERKTSTEYQFDQPSVCIPLVSSRGHGVASLNHVYYQEGRFALGNILCAITPKNPSIVLAKYLFFYFEQTKDYTLVPLMKGGANVALRMDDIAKVKVPIPSIDKQKEIISVLQLFEEYCTASLPAEIDARRQQYKYYQDKLLTFKEA